MYAHVGGCLEKAVEIQTSGRVESVVGWQLRIPCLETAGLGDARPICRWKGSHSAPCPPFLQRLFAARPARRLVLSQASISQRSRDRHPHSSCKPTTEGPSSGISAGVLCGNGIMTIPSCHAITVPYLMVIRLPTQSRVQDAGIPTYHAPYAARSTRPNHLAVVMSRQGIHEDNGRIHGENTLCRPATRRQVKGRQSAAGVAPWGSY